MGDLEGKKFSKGMKLAIALDDTVEPASAFSKRLSKWWNGTMLQSLLSKSKGGEEMNVLIVTHGGVIGTLVRDLLGSRKIKAGSGVVVVECLNASVTVVELEYGSRTGSLVRYGDVAHLAKTTNDVTPCDL
jgi:probable phosphoglycerate mutase